MAIDEKLQAELYARLESLDIKIAQLDKASFIDKSSMAQIVITDTRNLLFSVISNQHSISNEVERLRALIS